MSYMLSENKILEKMFNEIVELKFNYIVDINAKNDIGLKEYTDLAKNIEEILNKIRSSISKDLYKLIIVFIGFKEDEAMIYMKYFFKKGIVLGLTDMNFLREIEKKLKDSKISREKKE